MAGFLPTQFPAKDPTAILDYAFDFTSWLATNETITTATVTVTTGITIYQPATISGGVVTFWLSGGTVYQTYLIECEITTSQGRTDSRSSPLTCQIR